jgi:hypothetical protein
MAIMHAWDVVEVFWLIVNQLRPSDLCVVWLDDPIWVRPLRRGSVRVYGHYAKIMLIVYVVKLGYVLNCELVS